MNFHLVKTACLCMSFMLTTRLQLEVQLAKEAICATPPPPPSHTHTHFEFASYTYGILYIGNSSSQYELIGCGCEVVGGAHSTFEGFPILLHDI